MPTKEQLHRIWEQELEFPQTRNDVEFPTTKTNEIIDSIWEEIWHLMFDEKAWDLKLVVHQSDKETNNK